MPLWRSQRPGHELHAGPATALQLAVQSPSYWHHLWLVETEGTLCSSPTRLSSWELWELLMLADLAERLFKMSSCETITELGKSSGRRT